MSRTFNDQPWWYRATEWSQIHMNCGLSYLSEWGSWSPYRPIKRECDLPAEPDLKVWRAWDCQGWRARESCMWVPKYPRTRQHAMPGPPKWYRDHTWNNAVRTREREYRQKALKEYRANGDVEEVLLDDQHRHMAQYLYW